MSGRHPYGYPASIGNAKPRGCICFWCSDMCIWSYLVLVVGHSNAERQWGPMWTWFKSWSGTAKTRAPPLWVPFIILYHPWSRRVYYLTSTSSINCYCVNDATVWDSSLPWQPEWISVETVYYMMWSAVWSNCMMGRSLWSSLITKLIWICVIVLWLHCRRFVHQGLGLIHWCIIILPLFFLPVFFSVDSH